MSLMNTSLIYRVFSRFSENTYLNGLCNVFVMLLPVSLLSAFATLIGNGLMIWGFESEANYLLFISRLVWMPHKTVKGIIGLEQT